MHYTLALTLLSALAPIADIFANPPISADTVHLIDFKKVFISSPLIYSFLSFLSISALAIWIYSVTTIRAKELVPRSFCKEIKELLETRNFDQAKDRCDKNLSLLASLIRVGLTTRNFGPQIMIDSMKSEGKRIATPLWQRLSLLNDIAIVAPMIGLLGTVIGMFYAFYDVNRSVESINTLFDGLGIAVGTTVFGLIVAILAMLFSTTLKYRLVKTMSHLENESLVLSSLIIMDQR
jgi:biopolymer transport protein ExbB